MFLLEYVSPKAASDTVAAIYGAFPEPIGPPQPLQLMSASPGFLACQSEILRYFGSHRKLSFPLLTAIRYMAANDLKYEACIQFNRQILIAAGADEKSLAAIVDNPDNAPLEAHERAMLKFVARAIRSPERIEQTDIDCLRDLGWEDADILDATAHGAFMGGHAILMRAFSEKPTDEGASQ